MASLGVDRDSGQVYFGNMYEKSRLAQGPVFPTKAFPNGLGLCGPDVSDSMWEYVFHELSFDPITNVRRGYIWKNPGRQPQVWYLDGTSAPGTSLITFTRYGLSGDVDSNVLDVILLTFGDPTNYTIGELIHSEQQVDQMELLTIRMRRQFGLLPKLRLSFLKSLGKNKRKLLNESLEKVIEGFRRSPAESVIDRCRDAMTVILQINTAKTGKDLGELVKVYEAHEQSSRTMVGDLAHVVARLHARAKPAESHRGLAPVSEREAELSVNAVGTVLVTMNYASWN